MPKHGITSDLEAGLEITAGQRTMSFQI